MEEKNKEKKILEILQENYELNTVHYQVLYTKLFTYSQKKIHQFGQ